MYPEQTLETMHKKYFRNAGWKKSELLSKPGYELEGKPNFARWMLVWSNLKEETMTSASLNTFGTMRHQNFAETVYFLVPISRESIVFVSNFQNGDFDEFTRFEVPWTENHIFSVLSVCMNVWVFMCLLSA